MRAQQNLMWRRAEEPSSIAERSHETPPQTLNPKPQPAFVSPVKFCQKAKLEISIAKMN
jgi:hypothetical protein